MEINTAAIFLRKSIKDDDKRSISDSKNRQSNATPPELSRSTYQQIFKGGGI
jgi:hypothetical protein